jgi:hypothetical protein
LETGHGRDCILRRGGRQVYLFWTTI